MADNFESKMDSFFESNVEGKWEPETELVCSNNLICSDYLILLS